MRIVFKGVITDYNANLLKRRLTQPKANLYASARKAAAIKLPTQFGVPKGNLYIITSRSKTFH